MKIKQILLIEEKLQSEFPDIDIDIDGSAREKVMTYFHEKYGKNHAAFVGNKNFYSLKSAVQDVSSTFEIPSQEMFAVTKFLNDDYSIEENMNKSEKVMEYFTKYPEVKDIAEKIIGVLRNMSIHAGGVVLTDKKYPIDRFCPLQRTSDGGALATLFDKNEIEKFGYVKYDILGLNTAKQIQDVRKLTGYPLYEDTEPYKDEVFQNVVIGLKNKNIFQFETDLGKRFFQDLMPMNVRDIAVASALIRILDMGKPGIELSNKYRERVQRAQQDGNDSYWKGILREEIEEDFVYETLIDILKESFGVLVYQEQLCYFASRLSKGKLTFSDGNKLRKALGKFKLKYGVLEELSGNEEKLKKWHSAMIEILDTYILPFIGKDGRASKRKDIQEFLSGKLIKNSEGNLTLRIPEYGLLSWMITGSGYLFSKLHSIAYSKMGYVQMYQKHFYPREFWYSAIINRDKKKLNDLLASIKNEKADIEILPPNINTSNISFTLEGKKGIRFGLSYIASMNKMADKIIEERNKKGKFKSIEDFLSRCKPNKKQLENLLFSNALVDFGNIKDIYFEIVEKELKVMEDVSNFSEDALSKLEYQALTCNITFMSEFLSKALDYISIEELPEDVEMEVCVRIEKKTQKKTKTGKDYFLFKLMDYNSSKTFNGFEWNTISGEKLNEGDNVVMKIKRKGDFHTICHNYDKQNNYKKNLKKFLKF